MKNISLETALKIGKWVGIVVAFFVALWLLGIAFKVLGIAALALVALVVMVLKFALVALVVVGICFVLAKVARAAADRKQKEAIAANAHTVNAEGATSSVAGTAQAATQAATQTAEQTPEQSGVQFTKSAN
jgi:type VI protein secretion system component VasK